MTRLTSQCCGRVIHSRYGAGVAVDETDTAAAAGPVRLARRPLLVIAGAVAALLVATSWRYGFHRDELYFLVAGRHPDWGYPDQPPLTPVLIRLMDLIGAGSIVVVRLPSALAAGATVLLAGMTAREMGGGRRAQLIAAACTGVSATTLVTGHFVSTTTYDVLFSAALTWLLARAVRTGENWLLLPAGLALGAGPAQQVADRRARRRAAGRDRAGRAAPAAALRLAVGRRGGGRGVRRAVPGLAGRLNGWPQLDMAGSIAGGDAQGGRIGFIPFQLLLVSPVLAPVWIAGLVRLLRAGPGRPFRVPRRRLPAARGRLPDRRRQGYYLAGMYPALLAAGAIAADGWLRELRGRIRLLAAALALSLVVGAIVGLAVLPARCAAARCWR